MTFTSSELVQIVVLHEISSQESLGQPTWTVDGKTIYGISLIDLLKNSGSFEFTGAAFALYSPNSKKFTTTVSLDGWIRGQPTEVIMQKIEFEKDESSYLLSRTNVLATILMHKEIYEGNQIHYIITDGSDKNYAKSISDKQEWNVEFASVLVDVPENALQKLYIFKNGVKGDEIYGFQNEVFSSTPSQESEYSALNSIIEITWKVGQTEVEVESESAADIIAHSGAVDLFQFKNGIIGSGPLGFQASITGVSLGDANSPMWRIYLVEWNDVKSAQILETRWSDIDSFGEEDKLSVSITRLTNGDHIVNSPLIDPFQ